MFKKIAAAIAMTGLMAGMAYAGAGFSTGINGSKHDMNTFVAGGADGTLKRSCVFCHTPHNALDATAPLWNRTATANAMAPYVWVTPANSTYTVNSQVGPTRLCMSCHDGVITADSHGATAGTKAISGNAKLTNLAATHPIGFDYDAAATGRGVNEIMPSSNGFIANDITTADFNTFTRGTVTQTSNKISAALFGTKMTCATCHDVHNTTSIDTAFLRSPQKGSAICLSCHVK